MSLWENHKIAICVGTGGVGKTTVSAALALAATRHGARTLAITVDPAKRLAHALGLKELSSQIVEVPREELAKRGIAGRRQLSVMLLDVKHTFDELITSHSENADTRKAIFENRLYQEFSKNLAGALEYAAVEKLYKLYLSGNYDFIVVDTPPSQNALSFLDAPARMVQFIDQSAAKWIFKSPSLWSMKLLDIGSTLIQHTFGKMAGGATIRELVAFLTNLSELYAGFSEHHQATEKLLKSEKTAFVLVSSSRNEQGKARQNFVQNLFERGFPLKATIINRVREPLQVSIPHNTLEQIGREYSAELRDIIHHELLLIEHDQALLQQIRTLAGDIPLIALPDLAPSDDELTNLVSLQEILFTELCSRVDSPGR
ncbi:MAG: ArsA-related P-loop ATPase [Myxococcota bacterium]|nr:ArsA-related P-loop ATPase [Myxococcota bacterium]